jgi:N-ethylmaleimide reductase
VTREALGEKMSTEQALLKEYDLSGIKLRNRMVMAPMTRSRANNPQNAPTDLMAQYYRQRASAGLIISEGSQISTRAVGGPNTPGIYSQEQVEGWKLVTRAVHDKGGKIFLQLWHVGRMSHPDFLNGEPPLAPSAVDPHDRVFTREGFKETVTPRAMTLEEIQQTVQDYKNGAKNAMDAGFDGVEIHSSNGYLLHQFFNRPSNVRSDRYGGSIENRARILFEVIDAIKTVMPENRIGARLNPSAYGFFGVTIDEQTIPTFDYIVERLNRYQLAYLHLSEPFTDVTEVSYAEPHIAKRYRPKYRGTLIINSNFTRESGNQVIEDGLADLVAFGKLFISNPDLPKRFEINAKLQEWDGRTFYGGGEKGYTDYPSLNGND